MKELNGTAVRVEENTDLNVSKSIIYIYGYNMLTFEKFKEELAQDYGLTSVTEPQWIKRRNNGREIPLMLEFRRYLPTFTDVTGEQARTRVLEYKKTPVLCR